MKDVVVVPVKATEATCIVMYTYLCQYCLKWYLPAISLAIEHA